MHNYQLSIINRRQAESHQACLNGRGAKEEDEVNGRGAKEEGEANYPLRLRFLSGLLIGVALLFAACRGEEEIVPSTATQTAGAEQLRSVSGFYLLNEGNMGSNKCTLDYFDYSSGIYRKNIFPERNPGVVHELGDVGNDIGIYGGKLYAVINCSHFVEVMDARTCRHLTQISVPNCRSLAFDGGYVYVTSFAGPVQVDPNARLGYVARIDTLTMQVTDTCTVGYQPEQLAVCGGKLYVANSGGYRVPDYDRTVSVIDLATFRVVKTIDVAPNLQCVAADTRRGMVYVSSRGDYTSASSAIHVIDTHTDEVTRRIPVPCSTMALSGDSLYVISQNLSWHADAPSAQYVVYDLRQEQVVSYSFITDGTEADIAVPYGLAVNPENGDILVTDARDYVTPGRLHGYSRDGRRKWSVTTGDIPAHIAFCLTF